MDSTRDIATAVLLLVLFVLAARLRPTVRSLWPLLEPRARVQLAFHPDEFTGLRFQLLFLRLVARTVLRRLGVKGYARPRLVPLTEKEAEHAPANTFKLDEAAGGGPIAIDLPFRIRPKDLEHYAAALGLQRGAKFDLQTCKEQPAHLPLLLAGLTMPAVVLITAKRGCPFDPIGTVNTRNRAEVAAVDKCLAALEEEMLRPASTTKPGGHDARTGSVKGLRIMVRCGTRATMVKRGWEWSLVCELLDPKGGILFRQTVFLLDFERHATPPSPEGDSRGATEADTAAAPTASTVFRLRDPRLWATVSRDTNPMHMSTLAAKMLGFKNRIAHGYHVSAKSLAAVVEAQGAGAARREEGKKGVWLEADFRRPTVLPARLDLFYTTTQDGGRIESRVKEKVTVIARWGST